MEKPYYPPEMDGPNSIEELIRNRDVGECLEDQIIMAYWFYNNDITASKDREKRTAEITDVLEDQLEHEPETVIENLISIDVLEHVPTSGSGKYIRNHRTEENFYTPNEEGYLPRLKEEITRLLLDIRDKERIHNSSITDVADNDEEQTIRQIAATAIGVRPNDIVMALTGTIESIDDVPELDANKEIELTDPVERMNNFDSAMKAIIAHEGIKRGRDYEPMGWRNVANRYTMTQMAAAIEDNQSISDFS